MKRFLTGAARAAMMLLAVIALGAMPASAGELSEAQKAEVKGLIEQYVQENPEFIRDYLLKNPEILLEVSNLLRARQAEQERVARAEALSANRDRIERHPITPVSGNPDGDVTVVEFFDYNCPWCKKSLSELVELEKEDPNLRFVWKEFPVLSAVSVYAARAAMAADRQGKYMEFHLAAMGGGRVASEEQVLKIAEKVGLDMDRLAADMKDPAITEYLQETMQLAETLGISGTPSFVIGDHIAGGYISKEEMRKLIDQARRKGS